MLRNARLTSVFLCVLMLVSCARTAPPDISRQLEEVDLREVIGVLSVSPEYHYDEFGIRPSYIVFIYRDGSTRPIRVGETVFADVSWVSGSLFFADKRNDYWVMSGGEVRIHRADHIKEQNGIVELETDDKRVMLLNAGFTPNGGYRQQMDISSPEGSHVSEIGAFSTIFAACGDDAFIIGTQPPDGPEDDNRSTSTLYQVVDEGTPVFQQLMQQYSLLEETGHMTSASHPCWDGRIVALTTQTDYGARPGQSELSSAVPSREVDFDPQSYVFDVQGGKDFYAVETWDVNRQTMDTIPLVNPDGSAFSYADPEKHFLTSATQDDTCLRENKYYWASSDNTLMRTNIDSGITEKMADTTEGAAHTYLYCTDNVITIFEYGDDRTDKPWGNFHYFDPVEGKITSTTRIRGLESLNLKDYLRIHDFEANPDLAAPHPRS